MVEEEDMEEVKDMVREVQGVEVKINIMINIIIIEDHFDNN